MSARESSPWLSRHWKWLIGTIIALVPVVIAIIALLPPPGTEDFVISISPQTGTVNQDGTTTFAINLECINGYTKDVLLKHSGEPQGVIVNIDQATINSGHATAAITLDVGPNVTPKNYEITFLGRGSDGKEHTLTYTLVVVSTQPTQSSTALSITTPANGATVNNVTKVEGTAQNLTSGQAIWPIVYVSSVAMYYPMSSAVLVSESGVWQTTVMIGGPNDVGQSFDIIMVIANETGNNALVAYNQDVEKNHPGDYPGMGQLPMGLKEYDRVTVIRGP